MHWQSESLTTRLEVNRLIYVSVIFLNVLHSDLRVAAIDSVLITMRAQPQQSAMSFL